MLDVNGQSIMTISYLHSYCVLLKLQNVKELIKLRDYQLTVEERNLFSVACKYTVGPQRSLWKAIACGEQYDPKGELPKIEAEVKQKCMDVLVSGSISARENDLLIVVAS